MIQIAKQGRIHRQFFCNVHVILYLCIFTRLLRHPLGSSTLHRRVLIKLIKTSVAMFVSEAARIVCLTLYLLLQDHRLQLRLILGVVYVTTATIDPIIYGYLRINLKTTADNLCSGCFCTEPQVIASGTASIQLNGRSEHNTPSKVSQTTTKRENDQEKQTSVES